jgi:hypothetical protein
MGFCMHLCRLILGPREDGDWSFDGSFVVGGEAKLGAARKEQKFPR